MPITTVANPLSINAAGEVIPDEFNASYGVGDTGKMIYYNTPGPFSTAIICSSRPFLLDPLKQYEAFGQCTAFVYDPTGVYPAGALRVALRMGFTTNPASAALILANAIALLGFGGTLQPDMSMFVNQGNILCHITMPSMSGNPVWNPSPPASPTVVFPYIAMQPLYGGGSVAPYEVAVDGNDAGNFSLREIR